MANDITSEDFFFNVSWNMNMNCSKESPHNEEFAENDFIIMNGTVSINRESFPCGDSLCDSCKVIIQESSIEYWNTFGGGPRPIRPLRKYSAKKRKVNQEP